ncbi:MAG TPA: hypothetical protein VNY51_11115 [Candidatus Dormibacteraeota bacterium]|nr:hypothetical protein [Candidatus Dormibacteraeota bacterium]
MTEVPLRVVVNRPVLRDLGGKLLGLKPGRVPSDSYAALKAPLFHGSGRVRGDPCRYG